MEHDQSNNGPGHMEGWYEAKIEAFELELAKYKAAAVVGGDGEPICINGLIFVRDYDRDARLVTQPALVNDIHICVDRETKSKILVMVKAKLYRWKDREVLANALDCYSSPEAVPGGAE